MPRFPWKLSPEAYRHQCLEGGMSVLQTIAVPVPSHLVGLWHRRDKVSGILVKLNWMTWDLDSLGNLLSSRILIGCGIRCTLRLTGPLDCVLSSKILCICLGEMSVVRWQPESHWGSPSPSTAAGSLLSSRLNSVRVQAESCSGFLFFSSQIDK